MQFLPQGVVVTVGMGMKQRDCSAGTSDPHLIATDQVEMMLPIEVNPRIISVSQVQLDARVAADHNRPR